MTVNHGELNRRKLSFARPDSGLRLLRPLKNALVAKGHHFHAQIVRDLGSAFMGGFLDFNGNGVAIREGPAGASFTHVRSFTDIYGV